MKIREKKAISLIVLVITILVLSILAATVIISLSNTNIISETSKTVLKSDLAAMQDMATVYFADNYNSIDMEKEYLITEFGITDDEFEDYRDFAFVKAGKVYIKPNAPEDIQEVAKELNMLVNGVASSTGDVTIEKAVNSLKIYGNSIQNGVPSESTPVAIESVGDKTKNLFNVNGTYENVGQMSVINNEIHLPYSSGASTCATFDYIAVEPQESITISYKLIQGKGRIVFSIYDSDKNIIDNSELSISGVTYNSYYKGYYKDATALTVTVPENVYYIRIKFAAYTPKEGEESIYSEFQVEKGNTATEYEPYGYNVPVTTVGKNIFNYDNVRCAGNATKKNNGIYYEGSNDIRFSVYQDLQKYIGKTVTMSFDVTVSESGTYAIYQYQNNGIGVKFERFSEELVADTPKRITITGEVAELGNIEGYSLGEVIVYKEGYTGSYFVENIQIEEGTTTTAYEAYTSKTYNMYLKEPLRKLGSSVDYLDCTTGEVVRYISVKDTTGTKSIAESFEVLTTPTKENATTEIIDFTNVKHVFVGTTVTPSNIEVKY